MYVMLDDDLPSVTETPQSELAVAQERIRGLEAQVAFLARQLQAEQERYDGLLDEEKTGKFTVLSQESRRTWWQFWQR